MLAIPEFSIDVDKHLENMESDIQWELLMASLRKATAFELPPFPLPEDWEDD